MVSSLHQDPRLVQVTATFLHLLLPQLLGEKEPWHQGWSCRTAGGVTETNLPHMPFRSLPPKTLPLCCKITREKLLLCLPAPQPSSALNVSTASALISHLICNSFYYKVALWPAKAFFGEGKLEKSVSVYNQSESRGYYQQSALTTYSVFTHFGPSCPLGCGLDNPLKIIVNH